MKPTETRAARPKVCHVVAGPNGSGKSTFALRFLPDYAGSIEYVNPDLVAQGLSPTDIRLSAIKAGKLTLARIAELTEECGMKPKKTVLVVNRAPNGELNEGIREEIEKHGLTLIGVIPQDETVYEYDCDGKPTTKLDESNPAKKAVVEIAKKLFA